MLRKVNSHSKNDIHHLQFHYLKRKTIFIMYLFFVNQYLNKKHWNSFIRVRKRKKTFFFRGNRTSLPIKNKFFSWKVKPGLVQKKLFFVWDNEIGDDGCRSLSENLPSLTQLQNLNLESNDCFIFSHFLLLLSMFTFCWNEIKKNETLL